MREGVVTTCDGHRFGTAPRCPESALSDRAVFFRSNIHILSEMVVPLGSDQPVFTLPPLEDIPDNEEDAPKAGLTPVRIC